MQTEIERVGFPIVVLGEPGMGKTTLLRWLGVQPGFVFRTARSFLRQLPDRPLLGTGQTLVIDALDEVASARATDPVNQVLAHLQKFGLPPFILSCRSAEWRGAIARDDILQDYGRLPVELNLQPLTKEEAVTFLAGEFEEDRSKAIIEEMARMDIEPLYGNPLTLTLIARLAQKAGSLPATRGELFERACNLLRQEHSAQHVNSELARLSETSALDAAGAAAAALILTGYEAISRQLPPADGDIHTRELATLPGGADIDTVAGCNLFRSVGPTERFIPLHRSIAEYLGARWLTELLGEASHRRVLALFDVNGGVPASLRGLHAWLAYFSLALAPAVFAKDPFGVLRYGDTNRLTIGQARDLLAQLRKLSKTTPNFRHGDWTRNTSVGLTQIGMADDLRAVIFGQEDEVELKLLLLELVRGSAVLPTLHDDLLQLVLDDGEQAQPYVLRGVAGQALISASPSAPVWRDIIRTLVRRSGEDPRRLAVELVVAAGAKNFPPQEISDVALGYLGLLPGGDEETRAISTSGPLYFLARDVPLACIDAVLDGLLVGPPPAETDWETRYAFGDFANTLISRRIAAEAPSAEQLLKWLRLVSLRSHHETSLRREISKFVRDNHNLRREIQARALLDPSSEQNVWERSWRLTQVEPGLFVTPDDVVCLLDAPIFVGLTTAPVREIWKGLVSLIAGVPEPIRSFARRQAKGDAELEEHLRQLIRPRQPEWKRRHDRRAKAQEAKRVKRYMEQRSSFAAHESDMASGELAWIAAPATAYFARFNDIDSSLPPRERIRYWLGDELLETALRGFEAVLARSDLPTPKEIAESYAVSRRWHFILPIVAAMCERLASGRSLESLPDDVLLAGRLGLLFEHLSDEGGKALSEALDELFQKRPPLLERYARLAVEPQLAAGTAHPTGLYPLMHQEDPSGIARKLAIEWLQTFPAASDEAERELLEKLVREGAWEHLRSAADQRRNLTVDEGRSLDWWAVTFLGSFEEFRSELTLKAANAPALLWHLRSLTGGSFGHDTPSVDLTLEQLSWIVRSFRAAYPLAPHPKGVMRGDNNSWDATDFLRACMNRIASDLTDPAISTLLELRDEAEDGYTPWLRQMHAQQIMGRREADFRPLVFSDLAAVVSGAAPLSTADLASIFLDELDNLQSRLGRDDIDTVAVFYSADSPLSENECRNRLLVLLRGQLPADWELVPERQMPNRRIADIAIQRGGLQLPVELKCQWNRELWTAASGQLDAFYAIEWRAQQRGVYLVLWFGNEVPEARRLKRPPSSLGLPSSAAELRDELIAQVPENRRVDLAIFVLDVSRQHGPG